MQTAVLALVFGRKEISLSDLYMQYTVAPVCRALVKISSLRSSLVQLAQSNSRCSSLTSVVYLNRSCAISRNSGHQRRVTRKTSPDTLWSFSDSELRLKTRRLTCSVGTIASTLSRRARRWSVSGDRRFEPTLVAILT